MTITEGILEAPLHHSSVSSSLSHPPSNSGRRAINVGLSACLNEAFSPCTLISSGLGIDVRQIRVKEWMGREGRENYGGEGAKGMRRRQKGEEPHDMKVKEMLTWKENSSKVYNCYCLNTVMLGGCLTPLILKLPLLYERHPSTFPLTGTIFHSLFDEMT